MSITQNDFAIACRSLRDAWLQIGVRHGSWDKVKLFEDVSYDNWVKIPGQEADDKASWEAPICGSGNSSRIYLAIRDQGWLTITLPLI